MLLAFLCLVVIIRAQVANYVNNGSFEDIYDCHPPSFPLMKAKGWQSIDSVSFAGLYFSTCNNSVPIYGNRYQFPKTGKSYIIGTWYYLNAIGRSYPRNRLKKNLQVGKTYCVKFFVNISNLSTVGIDGFGAYFGDSNIDTIKKCTVPLTYLNPQVKNPLGNVITDTLNWVPITGTFTANGTEKYMLLGNFLTNAAITSLTIVNTPIEIGTDVLIDDVSCIEMDAPAYAGPDKYILAGDSVYIGRERDFAVDPYCVWYQLPNTTSIDTTSGIWVKPTQTTTYVVQQNLECGSLKWDTVVVRVGYTGFAELSGKWLELSVYPNPADDFVELKIKDEKLKIENCVFEIKNSLGQLVKEQELIITDGKARVNTKDLESGVYVMRIGLSVNHFSTSLEVTGTVSKRFVVSR